MANEKRLKVEITKSGYQAALDNARDANGFKIKISKADVYDDKNNLRGTFDVVGKNIGQQQIALRISVVDKTASYGIKTIKLIDKYSGVEFAIISHPAGEMIDYINPHKIAYITCNLIITSLEDHTVTIIDSSTVDAEMGVIDGKFAELWEAIEHLPGVNKPGNQDTTGNAATASKLFTPRKIGGVSFDGSQDIDLPGVNIRGNQDTTGNAATATYAGQIAARRIGGVIFNAKTDIDLPGVNLPGNQDTSGNATTATRLQTVRTINGVPFDGTQNINSTPAGAIMYFAMNTAPVGWLKANGAAISRITYANLFAAIGTLYGSGDGKITFNLPDLRGEFLRGIDDGRGIDTGRQFASFQNSQNLSHNHVGVTAESGWHAHTGWTSVNGEHSHEIPISTNGSGNNFESNGGNVERWGNTAATGNHNHSFETDGSGNHTHSFSTDFNGGNEARPRNIALLACIKI